MKIKGLKPGVTTMNLPATEHVTLIAENPQFVEYEEGKFINIDKIFTVDMSTGAPYYTSDEEGLPMFISSKCIDNFKRLVGKTDED